MKVLLEEVYEHQSDDCPIVFIDLRVIMYKIIEALEYFESGSNEKIAEEFAKACWAMVINNPLPYLPYPEKGYRIIIGDDFKRDDFKYWRSDYLPCYKANRKLSNDRSPMEKVVPQVLSKYIEKSDIPIVREYGFECDDIAGSLYRLQQELKVNRKIFLLTLDSDWMQLVSDDLGIMFSNVLKYTPKLRSEVEVLQWGKKNGYMMGSPLDIVRIKYRMGDTADNIPSFNKAGKGIIDLIDPILKPGYNTEEELLSELKNKTSNTNLNHAEKAKKWCIVNSIDPVRY